MKRILIISYQYSQIQQLRTVLAQQSDLYQLCGLADNSVLGMNLIESTEPDVVIMPARMNFWGAEDLINYLLPGASVRRSSCWPTARPASAARP